MLEEVLNMKFFQLEVGDLIACELGAQEGSGVFPLNAKASALP